MSASRCEMLRDGEGYESEASYDAKRCRRPMSVSDESDEVKSL